MAAYSSGRACRFLHKTMKLFNFLERWIKKIDRENGYICESCGKENFDYPFHRFCEECESKLAFNDGKTCPKCGRSLVSVGVCLTCKRKLPSFAFGYSPFVYKDLTAALINRVKNGTPSLAYFFGEAMADYLQKHCDALARMKTNDKETENRDTLLLIPVPMTKNGLLARGYNQAEELAQIVLYALRENGYAAELQTDILEKRKETPTQKQLTFAERAENVAGAFHVHKRSACKDRTVLLVDDIMTTGSTGSECADRLYGAGAKEVLFLTATSLAEQK